MSNKRNAVYHPPTLPLHFQIVELLTQWNSLSVPQLRDLLAESSGSPIPAPTLYRHVNELIESQVLLRLRRKLMINVVWVSSMLSFTERLKNFRLGGAKEYLRLPKREGESCYFNASSLLILDSVWNNVHLELGLRFSERAWYGYNSHAWYSLGLTDTERRLQESLVANGFSYSLAYGNDSFLDRLGQRMIQVDGYRTALAPQLPFPKQGYAIWACDRFCLECIFPEKINQGFEPFFKKVTCKEDFNQDSFLKVFRQRVRCRLKVTRSRKACDRVKSILKEAF